MRIPDKIRNCVVFIGTGDQENFISHGTGFLLAYDGCRYLVTAHHVAVALDDSPFSIRVNKTDGTCDVVSVDPIVDQPWEWRSHLTDPSVDLAVMQFNIDFKQAGWNSLLLPEEMILSFSQTDSENIGIGDSCYAVGLFSAMGGKNRNLPVVHSGNIALCPGDESIPVKDWRIGSSLDRELEMEAYLVEATNLRGLSGAPVFVRSTIDFDLNPMAPFVARMGSADLKLLGVWHGSWEGSPATRDGTRSSQRVPIGMGIVTPAWRLVELLDQAHLVSTRSAWKATLSRGGDAKPN